jgi:hypothetical protein
MARYARELAKRNAGRPRARRSELRLRAERELDPDRAVDKFNTQFDTEPK